MKQASLARAITVTLTLKVLALWLLWLLFFSPSHRPPSGSGPTADHLLGTPEASNGLSEENRHGA